MTFYSDLAADADSLIREFGQAVTLTRRVEGAYNPETGSVAITETAQTGQAVVLEYAESEIDGSLILRGDKKLILSSVGITAPAVGDTCTIGIVHTIQNVKPLSPAGTVVMFELQVRA